MQHIVPANSISKYGLLNLFAQEFDRQDINIKPVVDLKDMYRTLSTVNPEFKQKLWQLAGYDKPPTISLMIKELAEYVRKLNGH